MGGLVLAWAVGESVLVYRWAKLGAPPTPGVLALSSAIWLGCAAVATYQPARAAATAFAWAVDLAVLMQVIGKTPDAATGWPPPPIDDPTIILPSGNAPLSNLNPGSSSSSSSSSSGNPLGPLNPKSIWNAIKP